MYGSSFSTYTGIMTFLVAHMGTWGLFPTSLLLLFHSNPLQTGKCYGSICGTLARVTLWCMPKAPLLTAPQ